MMERSLLYLLPSIAVAGGMGCGFVEEGLPVKEKRNSSEISAYSGRYGSLNLNVNMRCLQQWAVTHTMAVTTERRLPKC